MPPTTIDLTQIKSRSWTVKTSYNASAIITYNLALGASGGDLTLSFEGHPDFHCLPTFGTIPVIAVMGAVTKDMPDFLPNFQSHNHVHGEHYLESKAAFPIPKGAENINLETTAGVVEVVNRRSGVTVCVGITTREMSTGKVICYNEWTSFIMKVPGHGAPEKAANRGPMTSLNPTPTRPPDAVVEQKTTPEQGALYRAASGDLNPLHIDPAVAKKGGFDGPILTGTCTLGMGVKHVLDTFLDGDVTKFRHVKARLSRPVHPGEVVRTEMWRVEGGKILYRQCVRDRVVIRDATLELSGDVSKL